MAELGVDKEDAHVVVVCHDQAVVKSVKVSVVEVAELTNRSHRNRSSCDKAVGVGCALQANKCLAFVVKLPTPYRCRLVRRTLCVCSPAVDGSVCERVHRCFQSLLLVRYWGCADLPYSVVS